MISNRAEGMQRKSIPSAWGWGVRASRRGYLPWALAREEEPIRWPGSNQGTPHSPSSMDKERTREQGQCRGTKRGAMKGKPGMANNHSGLHPVRNEGPRADVEKVDFSSSIEGRPHADSGEKSLLSQISV